MVSPFITIQSYTSKIEYFIRSGIFESRYIVSIFKIIIGNCNRSCTLSHISLEVEEEGRILAIFIISHYSLILKRIVPDFFYRDAVHAYIRINGFPVRFYVQCQRENSSRHVFGQLYD